MRVVLPFLVIVVIVVFFVLALRWFSTELHLKDIFTSSDETTSTSITADRQTANNKPGISAGKEDSKYYIKAEKPPALTIKSAEPPAGFTQKDLSSYFDSVKLTSIVRPSRTNGGGFTLITDSSLKEVIDVTNWRVKSNRGEITLRGGSSPTGPVNISRIILRPRTSAIVYGGVRFPVVKNVELNRCTGYLNTVYDFNPKLPNNCPSPDRSGIVTFSGACHSFILSLSNCRMPTAEELNKFTGSNDMDCHEFLEDINYQNCYNEYSGESGFFSYGWRIWLEDLMPFDPLHDRLLLFDGKGLLVDEYVY